MQALLTRLRSMLLAVVLTLGMSLGLGVMLPQPAAAADPPLQVSITGDNTVYSWDQTLNFIHIRNGNSSQVRDVFFEVYDYHLPIDYRQVNLFRNGNAVPGACRIVDGWGMAAQTRATCDIGTLQAGEEVFVSLFGRTSVVLGSGSDRLRAKVYVNFPANTTADGSATKLIAWNP